MCKMIGFDEPDRVSASCRSGGDCARCHLRLDEARLRIDRAPSRCAATQDFSSVGFAAKNIRAMNSEQVAALRRHAPD